MLAHPLPKQTVISLIDNRSPSGETPRSRLAWLTLVIRPSEMGIDPGMEQPAVFDLAIVKKQQAPALRDLALGYCHG